MKLYDVTDIITIKHYMNYVCFNNSMVHICDNLFLMTYRVIKSENYYKSSLHPWNIWVHRDFNYKYRDNLYEQQQHINILWDNIIDGIPAFEEIPLDKIFFHDVTGICILEFIDDKFVVKYNNNRILDINGITVDARLFNNNNTYYLTYNTSQLIDGIHHRKMIYRILNINLEKLYIEISSEKEMLDFPHNAIEKNCVFGYKDEIFYKNDGELIVYHNKQLHSTPIPIFKKMMSFYIDAKSKKTNLHISLSTPPIKFNDKYLMAGHIKIFDFFNLPESPLREFVSVIDFTKISKYGFLYFMFFFEYDEQYNITRLSHCFIPTVNDSHLPYLLVFSSGLTTDLNDNILLSYGEGDCRSKIISFTKQDVENLLIPLEQLEVDTYDFKFLKIES